MSKLPWAKYYFSIFIVAVLATIVAKFVTTNPLILIPLSVVVFWVSIKGFSRIRGYQ